LQQSKSIGGWLLTLKCLFAAACTPHLSNDLIIPQKIPEANCFPILRTSPLQKELKTYLSSSMLLQQFGNLKGKGGTQRVPLQNNDNINVPGPLCSVVAHMFTYYHL